MASRCSFAAALLSDEPASEYTDKLKLYGQFVGDWRTETTAFLPDGRVERSMWEVRFSWALEGRAVQDLWITPPRGGETHAWHEKGNRYSTTLRIYDPALDAWQIIWTNPPTGSVVRQIGRQVGDEIVQIGEREADGGLTRWVYRDITPNSFRWFNEHSADGGSSWIVTQEMRAQRIFASSAGATDRRTDA
jgi:hypothetical protein